MPNIINKISTPVGFCMATLASFSTLVYIMDDLNKTNMNKLKQDYEKKMEVLKLKKDYERLIESIMTKSDNEKLKKEIEALRCHK